MDLYINGAKIDEETIKKYDLKAGMASPFSAGVITNSPEAKGDVRVEALKRPVQDE